MIKLWGKIITNNKIKNQHVVVVNEDIEYQEELKKCIIDICYNFDIQKPYWLNKNLIEYNKIKKTSFTQDNFIEEIFFDKLVIEVLEEK
jgi:hypothetical protein